MNLRTRILALGIGSAAAVLVLLARVPPWTPIRLLPPLAGELAGGVGVREHLQLVTSGTATGPGAAPPGPGSAQRADAPAPATSAGRPRPRRAVDPKDGVIDVKHRDPVHPRSSEPIRDPSGEAGGRPALLASSCCACRVNERKTLPTAKANANHPRPAQG